MNATETETIGIVFAEDDFFSREGIRGILSREPSFQVLGETDDGERAIELVRELQPRVLLLDIRMPPGIDGLEVIRRLRAEGNPVLIIALTNEKRMIRMVEEAGGNGFIPKERHKVFVPTIQCVARTGSRVFIDPEVSDHFRRITERIEAADLSELDMQIWRLIAYKNEEIGRKIFRAPGRVRNMVTQLYTKLGIPKEDAVAQPIRAIELARLYGVLEEPVPLDE